jgi:hypothetical protein
VRQFEPEMVEQLVQEHREVVKRLATISKFLGELKRTNVSEKKIEVGIRTTK